MMNADAQASPLGKASNYAEQYDPRLLFPISRQENRDEIGVPKTPPPFFGQDLWNAYELSWLNSKGKPVVALANWQLDCRSSHIIESKSVKLYLNSLANTVFDSLDAVQDTLNQDLSAAANYPITVTVTPAAACKSTSIQTFEGTCLDELDISMNIYHVAPQLLELRTKQVTDECVYSHLVKSNCLVTQQPDWASVQITYTGRQIHPESLLRYLVSYRQHNAFHEQCVERIFMDILTQCAPESLTVYARYTRRGGIDINPFRSTQSNLQLSNEKLFRQ